MRDHVNERLEGENIVLKSEIVTLKHRLANVEEKTSNIDEKATESQVMLKKITDTGEIRIPK